MASAWGASWGSAWGDSWGAVVSVSVGGGIGHGRKSAKKKNRLYLERDSQILLFSSKKQIEAFLEAEKPLDDGFIPVKKKSRVRPKVIKLDEIKEHIPEVRVEYLVQQQDFDELLLIQAKILNGRIAEYLRMMQDERDIEILLLAS